MIAVLVHPRNRDRQGAGDAGTGRTSTRCRNACSLAVAALSVVALAMLVEQPAVAAGPKVHVVLAAQAEPLEKFAADEMAGQLKKLFEADVTIGTSAPAEAANVVLLGNPATHDEMKRLNLTLPKLSDQGHALKSVKLGDKTVLVVAGGSPRAVMWAAYELGWKFGIRYFLFGDLFPTRPKPFMVEGFDVVLEPKSTNRCCMLFTQGPLDAATWSADECARWLGQQAKLRLNCLVLDPSGWMQGRTSSQIRISVSGDSAGRAAFQGKKFFENPVFEGLDADGRVHRGEALNQATLRQAERLGMNVRPPDSEESHHRKSADLCVFPQVDFLSVGVARSDFDPALTPDRGYDEILGPVCGEGVAERVRAAFDHSDTATIGILKNDPGFALVNSGMLLKHFDSDEPPPAWWGEVRTNYLNAMSEMYRANTRAREGGRQFTLWYARRFEFGFEYMNAVEALRKAGIAKRKGNRDEQIAELEKALDAITNACNAMAAVARSQSDRGVIAVMNEYGYRPVTKLLEAADAGN